MFVKLPELPLLNLSILPFLQFLIYLYNPMFAQIGVAQFSPQFLIDLVNVVVQLYLQQVEVIMDRLFERLNFGLDPVVHFVLF